MPFSKENNYTPETFDDVMTRLREGVNAKFGTSYTQTSFVGTGWYKFFYPLVQQILETENLFAQTYAKLQDYIRQSNEKIAQPKTPREGLIEVFKQNGYTASLKPQTVSNGGTLYLCVDLNPNDADFNSHAQKVWDLLKTYTVAGLYYNGTHRGTSRLSNGQDFTFAFDTPTRTPIYLKLQVQLSQNSTIVADKESVIKEKLLANLDQFYHLGNNFEPARYFTVSRDAPYAAAVALSYSTDDETYSTAVYQAEYTDLFVFDVSRISVEIV